MSDCLPPLRHCRRCQRLVDYRLELGRTDPAIIDAPVGSWGAARPSLLIVGLAPGRLGAARSGKAFVGDASSDFLFQGLFERGFATSAIPAEARLVNLRLTNVVKCLPPGNAPTTAERHACAGYLDQELTRYCPTGGRKTRAILCLGGVAYQAVRQRLGLANQGFAHGIEQTVTPRLTLLGSYHPSRLNVNTGRMTAAMLDRVLARCGQLIAP